MNEVINSILTRRSIRKYKDTQVSDEDLNTILECAQYAPSGMNNQGWYFTVVQNKDMLKKIKTVVSEALAKPADFDPFYNSPTIIIVSNSSNITPEADSALAIENIFLSAHSLGIGSCWINILNGLRDNPKVQELFKELQIPENSTVYGSVSLGYNAGEEPSAPPRKTGTVTILK